MKNHNHAIGRRRRFFLDRADCSIEQAQADTTPSRLFPLLLLAAGLLAWADISIADEKPADRPQTAPPGLDMSAGDIAKMQQEAMNMLKEMQKSGLLPADVEIPANVQQSGGAETQSGSASTSSSHKEKSTPPPEEKRSAREPTAEQLKPIAEYSATSYVQSTGSGAMRYRNGLTIQQGPQMIRFEPAENKQGAIQIFRYDKGIVWTVHPESRLYPGVKKYQEFELRDGTGFNSHIDNLMQAYAALKNRDELKNLGTETVDGYATSHYQKRDPIPWLPNEFVTIDYWISDAGVLMKVLVVTPELSSVMETKAIRFGKQPTALFVPPPDYEKAGNMIDWAEEKRKLDAAGGT